MPLTLIELKSEVDETYKDLILQDWKDKSDYRGITRRSQKDFDNLIPMYARKIALLRFDLAGEWDFSCKVSDDGKKLNSAAEILDAVMQKMDDWYYANNKEQRLVDKFATCVKEVQMRKDGDVVRIDLHDAVTRYMCFTPTNAGTLTGTWTFTNGSNSVTASGDGAATTELAAGDYVRQSDGTAWYEVSSTPNNDTITLVTNFQQATHTDDAGVSKNADVSSMDGATIANAFVSFNQYTKTEIRTADDVLFVRANETHGTNGVNITFDENGNYDDYIKIIGCDSVTNDPWGDSSDVKPIIDFENLSYQAYLLSDHYWYLERLSFKQSNTIMVYNNQANYNYFKDCNFSDGNSSATTGLFLNKCGYITVDGCTFTDCFGNALRIEMAEVTVKNTTFTAGIDVGTDNGIKISWSTLHLSDSTFVGSFDTKDISMSAISTAWARNVNWSGSGIVVGLYCILYSEDDNSVFEEQITDLYIGTITRGTTSPRGGGADSFAIMAPSSVCGPKSPLRLGDKLSGAFKIWVATNAASTITIYARVNSAWASALAAGECYIKASYLSDAANADRTELQSSEQITNDAAWTALTITIPASNPKRDGRVYVWFYLEEYEAADKKVEVDIKPVIS